MSEPESEIVGVFQDAESARSAFKAAKANGFEKVHIVSEDPTVEAKFASEIHHNAHLFSRSPATMAKILGFVCAGMGFAFGVASGWLLSPQGMFNPVLPLAGLVFGGFVGVMISRGFTPEAEDFELGPREIVVAIEVDSPSQVVVAEKILTGHAARTF